MAEITNVHTSRYGARDQYKAVIATIDGATYTFEKLFMDAGFATQIKRRVITRGCPSERRLPYGSHYMRIDALFRALPEFAFLASKDA